MSYFERDLPPGDLLKHPTWGLFQNFGVQWSQLIALFWWGDPALLTEGEKSRLTPDEQKLRTEFIKLLQKQAKNTEIYAKCDVPDLVLTLADEASKRIKNLLLGEEKISRITLSDVLENYTTQPLMTTKNEEVKKMFKEMFNVQVITHSFVGKITYARGKDAGSKNENKYILELAYPPRPVFSDSTIEEKDLKTWAKQHTDGTYEAPPSCYVPWCVC